MEAILNYTSVPPPERFNFTRDVVDALAAEPARPAVTYVSRDGVIDRQTFTDVAGEASRWSNLLRAHGLVPGDRMLLQIGSVPGWHAAILGALKAGVVAVPCSEMLRTRDLSFRAAHSGARLLVAERRAEREIEQMEPQLETLYVDAAEEELRLYPAAATPADTKAHDPALILYTSGTTQEPKGVVHTHAYTWAKRLQATHWLDARPDDLVWCTAGTGWAKAIWNVLLGPWSRGAEVVVHDGRFDPVERFDLIARLGVDVLCQSPTEYRLMAKVDGLEQIVLPKLRHAVSAGEPLNPEVIKAFSDAFGVVIHDGYGQTENTLLVANLPRSEVRPGSMGRPTPGHVVHVIDEAGAPVPPGVEGEIALLGRPPSLFAGYWDDPEASKAAFRGEYYVTGDRATVDADGHFWFTGRSDDVILSAAYRIGPFEVESALLEHAAVAESAAVAKPDADRGQIVKAFVVLRAGHEPSDALAAELREHAKAVTAPYKAPREIEFVDALPKTSSGKIRRVELRERELRHAEEERLAQEARLEHEEEARDAERLAAAEREAERQEEDRRAAEHAAAERREAERAEAAQQEAARAETERREAAAIAAALRAAEREEADRLEAERAEAERRRAARIEAERLESERHAAARREAMRREGERVEEERRQAERQEAARREAARIAAERQEAARREAERIAAERQEAARREAERHESEQRDAELAEARRLEAERFEAARREIAHIEAELREIRGREAESRAARRQEEERRDAELVEAKRDAADRLRAARLRAEQRLHEEWESARARHPPRGEGARDGDDGDGRPA